MTVICSEANPILLASLQRQVRQILPEANVFSCRSSAEVKKTAQQMGCDVLITETDFGLRKGEGIYLAQEIKELFPQVNIIFATAGVGHEYAAQILEMKISGFLVKPFTKGELKKELGNLRYSKGVNYAEQII